MAVDSGQYNRKVIFKKPTTTVNDEGGQSAAYANELTVWAKIKRNNQVRALEANATALINSDTLIIRNADDRPQINKNWLVNYDSKDHVIHSIDDSNVTEVLFIVKAKE